MNVIDDLNRKLDRLTREPDNADLYNAIGVILCQVKDWGNAERYLCRAYTLNPSNRDILYNYTVILYLNQKYWEAASICHAGITVAPTDPELLEKLGDTCYILGQYDEAAMAYKTIRNAIDKVG